MLKELELTSVLQPARANSRSTKRITTTRAVTSALAPAAVVNQATTSAIESLY